MNEETKTELKSQHEANRDCLETMRDLLQKLRDAKPEERNELARRYAVTITETEKLLAYFWGYVINEGMQE